MLDRISWLITACIQYISLFSTTPATRVICVFPNPILSTKSNTRGFEGSNKWQSALSWFGRSCGSSQILSEHATLFWASIAYSAIDDTPATELPLESAERGTGEVDEVVDGIGVCCGGCIGNVGDVGVTGVDGYCLPAEINWKWRDEKMASNTLFQRRSKEPLNYVLDHRYVQFLPFPRFGHSTYPWIDHVARGDTTLAHQQAGGTT